VLEDWQHTRRRLADVEARMVTVLDELDLTRRVTSIDGLTAVGAATCWPRPQTCPVPQPPGGGQARRALSAGQRQRRPQGKASRSGRGRPQLRLAAWRAVWAALPNNPMLAARFHHLTTFRQVSLVHGRATRRSALGLRAEGAARVPADQLIVDGRGEQGRQIREDDLRRRVGQPEPAQPRLNRGRAHLTELPAAEL
jgi:hypothetical protein